jgi:hypothetical protein
MPRTFVAAIAAELLALPLRLPHAPSLPLGGAGLRTAPADWARKANLESLAANGAAIAMTAVVNRSASFWHCRRAGLSSPIWLRLLRVTSGALPRSA